MQQLSISDPRYNVREIVKQMILLEQHLLEDGKYCPDCISKHVLTIEALAEEGQNLDKRQEWARTFTPLVGKARIWAAAFTAGVPVKKIGQDVRQVRKKLAPNLLAPVTRAELHALSDERGDIGALLGFGAFGGGVQPWHLAVAVLGLAGFTMWRTRQQ